MHQILLIEDSEEFQKIVLRSLGNKNQIHRATTADEGFKIIEKNKIDLILLDITLPGRDGYSLMVQLQSSLKFKNIPVICLTGRKDITDKVTAFKLGADDYILKPFDPLELRARVEAKLSKIQDKREVAELISMGDLRTDRSVHRVSIVENGNEKIVSLTPIEFKLLCHMARQPDRPFTRDQLLAAAWSDHTNIYDRTVDVHICGLRRKLLSLSYYVKAVAGVGYKLSPELSSDQKTRKQAA